MEEIKTKAEQLTSHVGDLLETYYNLTVINITDKATRAATGGITFAVICILSLCILLLGGIGLSIWLGNLLDNTIAGYFLAVVFYILLLALFILIRKKIIFPYIRDIIIRKINL